MKFDLKKISCAAIISLSFIAILLTFNFARTKLAYVKAKLNQIDQQNISINASIESLRSEVHSVLKASAKASPTPKERYWEAPKNRLPIAITRGERIAHAGGALNGSTYTNSIEALNTNKAYFNIFEIDLAFTSDDQLVCSHDWINYPIQIFGKALESPPSLAEFIALTKANKKFTNCTIETLIQWLDKNPKAYIVTDFKADNLKGLTRIANQFPKHINRFKPQIYNMNQYEDVSALGFKDIILTIYNWGAPEDEIVRATRGVKLFAVTVPHFRAPFIAKKLKEAGNRVYAHTINSSEALSNLRWFEVDEIYTDSLID